MSTARVRVTSKPSLVQDGPLYIQVAIDIHLLRCHYPSTALTLSLEALLAQYRKRWAVEIALRDSNSFTGFGQDQCRKYTRVVGANMLRLVLAAARTLWFVAQASRTDALDLTRYRPWDRHKQAPSQLDIVWACCEALQDAGVFPLPRFTPGLATIPQEPENALPLAA